MRLALRSYARVLAWAILATLQFQIAAAAEDIRVLFVPSQDPVVQVGTEAFERAIVESETSLRIVKVLVDAQVLVQFTAYRLEYRKKDGPWRWWDGRVKLLCPPDAGPVEAAPGFRAPERFSLVIMGQDGSEMQRTVAALEQSLRKALGRERPQRRRDTI